MVLFFTLESIKKLRGLVTMETFSKSDISSSIKPNQEELNETNFVYNNDSTKSMKNFEKH